MYGFLKRYLPGPMADVLMALWYVLLILTVLYCASEPQAEFRYLMLEAPDACLWGAYAP